MKAKRTNSELAGPVRQFNARAPRISPETVEEQEARLLAAWKKGYIIPGWTPPAGAKRKGVK